MSVRGCITVVLANLALCATAVAEVPAEDCGLEPPSFVFGPKVGPRANELPASATPPGMNHRVARERHGRGDLLHAGVPNARLRTGALFGKTVYVSAGHGFYWAPNINRWATQRGNTNDVVEDLVSTETASQYLIPLLLNAGAYVVPVRESDPNPDMVIVDDGAAGYTESGDSAAFSTSSVAGFGPPPTPLPSGQNPFELGQNRLMEAAVGNTPTATAQWVPSVPKDGAYNVYISYTQFSYRVTDAHFVVRHAGGEAHFRVNQQRHGATWVFLGRFFFRKGQDPQRGAVLALNDSQSAGNISLDAVRLGGGTGIISSTAGSTPSPTSGRPRAEECARYHAQFMGAPSAVYDSATLDDRQDDVGTRSRFAAWDHEEGEDAVYVAWHTNACGGTTCAARGTDTYIYGANAPGEPGTFIGTPGSDVLAQFLHTELVGDLKKGWDPAWKDRGIHTAYFGEVNPNNNGEMPAVLLEVAFHHNPVDADQLKEPHFRYIAARAITQGIINYFAQKDGKPPTLPPEPPTAIAARNAGDGTVVVHWTKAPNDTTGLAGGPTTGYRLYQSADGFAWDDGVDVPAAVRVVPVPPGQVRYFRVTATNSGGESFPSEVVGAGVPLEPGLAPVLIVNAYDRLDSATAEHENLSAFGLGSPVRIAVERMNDGTYARRHGGALAQNAVPFDSATAGAVTGGALSLSSYALVDWAVGRGGAGGVQVSAAHQQLLRSYVEGGGRLLLSGTSVASALAAGDAEDQSFLAQILGAATAETHPGPQIAGVSGHAFDGLVDLALDTTGRSGAYPAGAMDVLTPVGATALATFTGTSHAAAVMKTGAAQTAFLSFPFETVVSDGDRAEVMARLLTALEVPVDAIPSDGGFVFPDAGEEEPEPQPDAGVESDAGTPTVTFATLPGEYPEAEGGCGCGGGGGALIMLAFVVALPLAGRRSRRPR